MTATLEERLAPLAADSPEDYAVVVEGLSVRYGGMPVIRDLDMFVPRGSIYGLVGPSGAGKTTALRALATLQPPVAGTILVDGIEVRDDPGEIRRRIGYLPDSSGVYDGLTAGEYLDFYGAIYRLPGRHRRQITAELLELVGLSGQRNRPVKSLSRSMRQQLRLARCLIHDPGILLLDEPASGMDPRARIELREILRELQRLDKTIVISSHLVGELAEICTDLGVMRAGKLVAEGPAEEIAAAATAEAELRVRLLDAADLERAGAILEDSAGCRLIEPAGNSRLRARFTGSEEQLAAIPGRLAEAGVRITEFALASRALEDVLLEMTEMETGA